MCFRDNNNDEDYFYESFPNNNLYFETWAFRIFESNFCESFVEFFI